MTQQKQKEPAVIWFLRVSGLARQRNDWLVVSRSNIASIRKDRCSKWIFRYSEKLLRFEIEILLRKVASFGIPLFWT